MTPPPIRTGYLVLADLSGFTSFVASTELEHAQGILSNLMDLLRRRLTPALSLAEIEGDALFLYAPAERFQRGETLLELIESTYVAFRDQIRTMEQNASCPCEACRMIPGLDLKFITHAGEWLLQDVTGAAKPFGSSVNLAHRLLKNDVAEATGWHAYALFTGPALDLMGVRPGGTYEGRQSYDHLGDCDVHALDLRQRHAELTARRRDFLSQDDAHFTVRRTYPLPRPELWQLLTDPRIRNLWETGSDWSVLLRPAGRAGPGATIHCAISKFVEEVLDWRPFDYFTVQLRFRTFRCRVTGELTDLGPECALRWSLALESFVPHSLRRPAGRFFATRLLRAPGRFESLDRFVAAYVAARNGDVAEGQDP